MFSIQADGTNAHPEVALKQIRGKCNLVQLFVWMVQVETRRAGDLGSNPGPDDNFFFKCIMHILS